jgi:hypothetical protein
VNTHIAAIGEPYYVPWTCGCCSRVNRANDSCECVQRGLRSDPMDMTAVRLCSRCGKCSIHCPANHTETADGGWGYVGAALLFG